MITRQYRLQLKPNLRFQGKFWRGQLVSVVTKPSPVSQWAVQISKRIDKRAVGRNRLRRQLLNWLYKHRDQLPASQILIILTRRPTDISEVFAELSQILAPSA